jgi:hypothetical protein
LFVLNQTFADLVEVRCDLLVQTWQFNINCILERTQRLIVVDVNRHSLSNSTLVFNYIRIHIVSKFTYHELVEELMHVRHIFVNERIKVLHVRLFVAKVHTVSQVLQHFADQNQQSSFFLAQ